MERSMIATAVLVVLLALAAVCEAICPYCTCPPSYKLVCARRKDTGRLRGFSSLCVMDCNNKCLPPNKQFEFLGKGRCGKLRPKTTTTTTTTTTATNRLK